jgi:hypothetical protein
LPENNGGKRGLAILEILELRFAIGEMRLRNFTLIHEGKRWCGDKIMSDKIMSDKIMPDELMLTHARRELVDRP